MVTNEKNIMEPQCAVPKKADKAETNTPAGQPKQSDEADTGRLAVKKFCTLALILIIMSYRFFSSWVGFHIKDMYVIYRNLLEWSIKRSCTGN